MLLLVMSLGVVVILMIEAGNPDNWRWFEAIDRDGQAEPDLDAGRRIDPRPKPTPPAEEIPAAFVSPPPTHAKPAEDRAGRYFRGVKPSYLKSVRDNTFFRADEQDAWFHLLEILATNDQQTLREASTGRVTYAQLFRQSDQYRGELVTIRDTMRRANYLTAPKNDYGIKSYYQTWVWPNDNPDQVIVVYCLHLPEGFPTGLSLSEQVEISGFYFKRWLYKAQGEIWLAPVLAARTVRWRERPPRAASPPAGGTASVVLVIIAAAAFGVLFTLYIHLRTRRGRPANIGTPVSFDAMRDADTTSGVGRLPQQEE